MSPWHAEYCGHQDSPIARCRRIMRRSELFLRAMPADNYETGSWVVVETPMGTARFGGAYDIRQFGGAMPADNYETGSWVVVETPMGTARKRLPPGGS